MNKRKPYFIMATIMMASALIANFRFEMNNGYNRLIPCFFGFIGGCYIYAASKINNLDLRRIHEPWRPLYRFGDL
jgi:hypothetical protein